MLSAVTWGGGAGATGGAARQSPSTCREGHTRVSAPICILRACGGAWLSVAPGVVCRPAAQHRLEGPEGPNARPCLGNSTQPLASVTQK